MITKYTTCEGTYPIQTLIDNYKEVYSEEDVRDLEQLIATADVGYSFEASPGFWVVLHD